MSWLAKEPGTQIYSRIALADARRTYDDAIRR